MINNNAEKDTSWKQEQKFETSANKMDVAEHENMPLLSVRPPFYFVAFDASMGAVHKRRHQWFSSF